MRNLRIPHSLYLINKREKRPTISHINQAASETVADIVPLMPQARRHCSLQRTGVNANAISVHLFT